MDHGVQASAASAIVQRFHEVLLSIYLYNEHRGYTKLEQLEAALRRHRPRERALADAVHKHAADERRHYRMFRAWFARRGRMPFEISARAGYIDRLVAAASGSGLDAVDLDVAVRDERQLRQLCRLIMLTEERGLHQVRWLLRFGPIKRDATLRALFEVVERDEPSHFEPYRAWLAQRDHASPSVRECIADLRTHLTIVWLRLPALMANLRLSRLDAFPA